MKKVPFPFVPPDLVKALEEAFPDRLPDDPAIPPAEFAALIGRQSIIRFLQRKLEQQEQTHRSL
jgi:hypothetical protein